MSAIDGYKHKCVGMVRCPSSYPLVYMRPIKKGEEQWIPIYRLFEDVAADDAEFNGNKKGDVIVGGGGGEVPALCITIPMPDDRLPYKNFWDANAAFYLCEGFKKVGWDGVEPIELWLCDNVLSFLKKNYPNDYPDFDIVSDHIVPDLCRLPTPEEAKA